MWEEESVGGRGRVSVFGGDVEGVYIEFFC